LRSRYIITVLRTRELVADKLPKTPSRKASGPSCSGLFRGRCAAGRSRAGSWAVYRRRIGGAAGTLGGYEFRARLVKAIGGKESPIALLEDVIAVGGAIWIVA